MGILQLIKSVMGLEEKYSINHIGCRAVKDNDEICGAEIMGQSNTGRIQYCSRHAPSGAVPYGRIGSIEFYIPEEDRIVEKN